MDDPGKIQAEHTTDQNSKWPPLKTINGLFSCKRTQIFYKHHTILFILELSWLLQVVESLSWFQNLGFGGCRIH